MKRIRLTYRDTTYYDPMYIKLQQLENKLESGQLIEFKHKVGDKLYGVIQCQREWYIVEVEINDKTFFSNEVRYFTIKFGWVTDDHLFATKEEAEAKLKELQG
jgi:hypothetical protein